MEIRLSRREFQLGLLAAAGSLWAGPGSGASEPSLRRRIGLDLRGAHRLREGVEWAAAHDVHVLENVAEHVPGALVDFPAERAESIRRRVSERDIALGLHTRSSVNVAELSPFVAEAVDAYLEAYLKLASRLGAEWIVVHGGYHFTDDYEWRKQAARDRLRRLVDQADELDVTLLLENHNPEPDPSEIRYLAHSIEECRYLLDAIPSPRLRWAFNAGHAHLEPGGVDAFLDALGVDRIGEVRLHDTRGDREEHLPLGEGTLDFASLLRRLETAGYRGPYVLAYGSPEDMLRGREFLLEQAARVGPG